MEICVSKAMSSVMLDFWAPKTTISAATKIANYEKIKEHFAVTKIRHAVRIVCTCRMASNVEKRLMLRASKKPDAPAIVPIAPNHRP